MRVIIFLLLFAHIVFMSGCCCFSGCSGGNIFKNKEDTKANQSKEKDYSKISPVEAAIEMNALMKAMNENIEKMSDPALTPDELAEIERENEEIREKMNKISEVIMEYDFIKNSKDPKVQEIKEQIKMAKERIEYSKQMQQQAIQEFEQQDVEDFEDQNKNPYTYDSEFYDENMDAYSPEEDNDFSDDVYVPNDF